MILAATHIMDFAPDCNDPGGWAIALNAAVARYGIDQNLEDLCEFLAQGAFESDEFVRLAESLSYSPQRLMAVWPTHFPTIEKALPYGNAPHRLADFIYAGRFGNGDEASGDGYRFRGRGVFQITFRNNYAACGKALNLPLVNCPDMLCTKANAAMSAAWYWQTRHIDSPAERGDAENVTRLINGGTTGLAAREKYLQRVRKALGVQG